VALLAHVKMTATEFGDPVDVMRTYRDKFVAHLDSDCVMNIPTLSAARASVWLYHDHIVQYERAKATQQVYRWQEQGTWNWDMLSASRRPSKSISTLHRNRIATEGEQMSGGPSARSEMRPFVSNEVRLPGPH
jgi:hypothetical protein